MALQSKSFLIYKGATLDTLSEFIRENIGLNAHLIKGIKGVTQSSTVTQLTLLYEDYSFDVLDSIAPREGAIFTTDVATDDFDVRLLFNDPIDPRSIESGTFLVDGEKLGTDKVYIDPDTNGYFLKLSLSGSSFQSTDFHTYQVGSTLKREDGSSYSYTPVGGYILHGLSSAHLGELQSSYLNRRRGVVSVAVLRLSKSINPQQGIVEFLSQRQLGQDSLLAYTPISNNTNTVDIYFLYISKLEPQIVSGFPLDKSLLPDVAAPGKVTFVYNTPLDASVINSTPGLFSIEEGFETSTNVPPSKVTLLSDKQTVEIDTSSYFTSKKVYSILSKPGLRSLEGLDKYKPEQWTIHIASYEGGSGTASGVSQEEFDALESSFEAHSGQTNVHYLVGDIAPSAIGAAAQSQFVILSGSVVTNTSNIAINTSNIAITSGEFSGHSGETDIHFEIGDIDHADIDNVGTTSHANIDSHIGDSTIHFTLGSTLTSIDLLGVSGNILYTTGTNMWGESPVSTFGLSLIDDTTASGARTTLDTTLQGCYVTSASTPEILTNTIGDAVAFRRGTAGSDSDHVVEVKTNAGITGLFIAGNGNINTTYSATASNDLMRKADGDATYMLIKDALTSIVYQSSAISGKLLLGNGTDSFTGTALSTFGQSLIDDTSASAARTTLSAQPLDATLTALAGLSTSADQVAYSTDSDEFSMTSLTTFARTLLDDANASTARTTLGAQASDADLTALAAVTIAADQLIYGTGDVAWASATLTAFARSILDDADAAAVRTTLGLGAVALLASIANANMASMSAATVKGSVGGGTPADLTMTQLQSIAKVKLRTPFHSDGGNACQLGAHPQTEQFLKNLNINIQIADLSTYSQVRMFCRIYTTSASSRSPRLIAKYHTSYTTTVGTYSDIGVSEVSCSMASYTLVNSGWIDLADGAMIDDCYITVTQIGGDSSATPRISSLFMEFR
jgi:hypothetical protein